jgi:ketosteroid isomerase-like protein
MHRILLLIFGCSFTLLSTAQNKSNVDIIRQMDQYNGLILIKRDTASLLNYVSKDFLLTPPSGTLSYGVDRIVKGIREGRLYLQFDVVTDTVYLLEKNTAISMGSETVSYGLQGQQPVAPIKRRYTNIWKREKGKWMLKARHSSLICNG